MYFLFSGEGSTDLGQCSNGASACESDQYQYGPMAVIVDHFVNARLGFSLLETGHYGFLSEGSLADRKSELKARRKAPLLPGTKRAKETAEFYQNARALSLYAKEKQADLNDTVIAVLFRDSDNKRSSAPSLWKDKRQSMINGFDAEGFATGVPMIPKPQSEAWLLCALKENPYQGCAALEDRSGGDQSPNPLKDELKDRLDGDSSREKLCEIVHNRTVDIDRIKMPSFCAFRKRLQELNLAVADGLG